MIGHLKLHKCNMPKQVYSEYKSLYCSICSSLRKQYGITSAIAVNHELTFVALALRPYFMPESGSTRCPLTGYFVLKETRTHELIHQCANVSYLLALLKIADWHADSPSIVSKGFHSLANQKLIALDSRSSSFQEIYNGYMQSLKSSSQLWEQELEMSSFLSGQIFLEVAEYVDQPIQRKEVLHCIFSQLGPLIAIFDAIIDLESDTKSSKYNPINELTNEMSLPEAKSFFNRDFNQRFEIVKQMIEGVSEVDNNISNALDSALIDLRNRISMINDKQTITKKSESLLASGYSSYPISRPVILACCFDDCCECIGDCCDGSCECLTCDCDGCDTCCGSCD